MSKEMWNIHLKITIKKNWHSQNFDFWEAPTLADIIEFWSFWSQLKHQMFGSKNVCGFSIILILKRIMTF